MTELEKVLAAQTAELKHIRIKLGLPEVLAQLAEEAA